MIDKEDYELIVRFDSQNVVEREKILSNPNERVEVPIIVLGAIKRLFFRRLTDRVVFLFSSHYFSASKR